MTCHEIRTGFFSRLKEKKRDFEYDLHHILLTHKILSTTFPLKGEHCL